MFVRRWIPLLPFLAVQSFLLFWNIRLLTLWSDEAFTLDTVTRPAAEILRIVRLDIHPPLYFLLLHAALPLLPGGDLLARIRAFSAIWALAATLVLDRLWLVRFAARQRYIALALWCCSPAVLLYGRMGRSYMMQTTLALAAAALTWRFLKQPSGRRMLSSVLALAALLYTHYAPGLAAVLTFGALLAFRAGQGRAPKGLTAVWGGLLLAAYLPWMLQFRDAFGRWSAAGGFSSNYQLTGGALTEHALKIAYAAVSFSIGECFPGWALAVAPAVAIVLWQSFRLVWRQSREFASMLLAMAVLGYLGVAHWVSYPFVTARLLWLLPFFVTGLALRLGSMPLRGAGLVIAGVLLAVDAASVASYHGRTNFLNNGYAVPLPEIAALVDARSDAADSLVLLDSYNTDWAALLHYLSPALPHLLVAAENQAEAAALLREPRFRHIWFIANTHDVSSGQVTSRLREMACPGPDAIRRGYLPFAAWERRAMRFAGLHPPAYFYEVDECFR